LAVAIDSLDNALLDMELLIIVVNARRFHACEAIEKIRIIRSYFVWLIVSVRYERCSRTEFAFLFTRSLWRSRWAR